MLLKVFFSMLVADTVKSGRKSTIFDFLPKTPAIDIYEVLIRVLNGHFHTRRQSSSLYYLVTHSILADNY